jgi:DNA repair exonuclease SbcCD ATPase subunit
MSTNRQQRKLEKIIVMAQDLLADMQKRNSLNGSAAGKTGRRVVRLRRTAEEAKKMKADVLAALKAGKPATAIAKRYKVSTAYIYMLKTAA